MNPVDDSDYFQKSDFNFNDTFDHFETIYSGEKSPSVIYTAIKGFKRFTVKGLKPEYQDDPYYIAQLRKEWEIGYSTDHPNIARYYSFEDIKGKGFCIVREWIDGNALDKYIENNPENSKILSLFNELCEGLGYLHKHLIVHGDLKPSNILVTNDGEHLKIIDFGFSDSPAYASMKLSGGNRNFASPEQKKEIDFKIGYKSDLFSLGKVIDNLDFKKSRKLKWLITRLVSQNPDDRPELNEVKKILQKNQNHRVFNLIRLWVGIALLFCLFLILIWRNNERPESNLNFNHEESSVSSIQGNPPIEQESLVREVHEKTKQNISKEIDNTKEENKGGKEEIEDLRQPTQERDSKNIRMDVHPLEIITYNETLSAARKNYRLYPDSIKDWKEATQKEIIKWLHGQLYNDEVLENKCLEAMEKGLTQFESTNPDIGSN